MLDVPQGKRDKADSIGTHENKNSRVPRDEEIEVVVLIWCELSIKSSRRTPTKASNRPSDSIHCDFQAMAIVLGDLQKDS